MKISIHNLIEKIDLLKSMIDNQRKENNTLKIENLFLKERIHKLKQATKESKFKESTGDHAQDFQFTSNENFSR